MPHTEGSSPDPEKVALKTGLPVGCITPGSAAGCEGVGVGDGEDDGEAVAV